MPPPPDDRPKPWPLRAGLRNRRALLQLPRPWSGACSSDPWRRPCSAWPSSGGALVGSIISGVFAAGGRTGSIALLGLDVTCWIGPPAERASGRRRSGPTRTAEADLHDVSGARPPAPNHHAGRNTNSRDQRDVRDHRRAEHRAEPVVLSASRAIEDFADRVHRLTALARRSCATMPTFSTPASFRRSNTSISSCSCTAPSPRRKTCLSVAIQHRLPHAFGAGRRSARLPRRSGHGDPARYDSGTVT